MKRIVPGFTGSDHGVEDGQELAHASDDGDFFGFAGGDEAIVELLDDDVEADRSQGGHVEAAPYLPAPAEDGPFAAHLAGIAIERRNADQGADLAAGQTPQFGDIGDQRGDGGWADAAHAGQPLGEIGMMRFDVPGEFGLDLVELGANGLDQGRDALPGDGMADRQSLMFGDVHHDHLPPARHQRLQRLLFGRWQGADETIPFGVARQFGERLGVDAVGLGQVAHGLGEISRLARIDDGHGEAGSLQGAGQVALQSSRGLHHDQVDELFCQSGDEPIVANVVVGECFDPATDADGGVEGLFGDIDADNDCFRHVPLLPSLPMRTWVKQLFGRPRNGHDGAPSAQSRACWPRGEPGCAAAPETADAVDLWTVGDADSRLSAQARSPMDKPWKTLRVSHRLPTGRRLPTSSTAYQQQRSYS